MTATRGQPGSPPASAPAATELTEPSAELGRAFRGLMAAVRRLRGRETRRGGGLSDAQYRLLFGLRDHEQLSSGDLACLADLSAATATEMLEGLAAAGLVARVRSDRDRRVVLTSLTERGLALLEERHAKFAPRWNSALSEFSDDQLHTAAAVLNRLHALFDELAQEPPESPESPELPDAAAPPAG
jgi:DNA-binding MarR family transcriptional regulator